MFSALRIILPSCQTLTKTSMNLINQQIRTTYVLKRKFAPQLHKKNMKPKTLRSRHYVYELVKDTSVEKVEPIKLILTANIEGVGNRGELVDVKASYAYNNLILLQKAVYATEENIAKYSSMADDVDDKPSSPNVPLCMMSLGKMTLSVIMNKESPWILKPWHIRVSFRKCGWEIPEKAIILPESPISGPNLDLENKEFFITVEFSSKEKQEVRCRLHHWSTDPTERLPYVKEFWKIPTECLFEKTHNGSTETSNL